MFVCCKADHILHGHKLRSVYISLNIHHMENRIFQVETAAVDVICNLYHVQFSSCTISH
jgi:hypothetical protein